MKLMVLAGAAVAALGASLLGLNANAESTGTVLEGEAFTDTGGAVMALADTAASGGRLMALWTTTEIPAGITLPMATQSVTVRTRGDVCAGGPTFRVKVDGVERGTATVTSSGWTDVTLPVALGAGAHAVTFAFLNDYGTGCDRNLYLDKLTFSTTAPVTGTATGGEVETWTKSYANVGTVWDDSRASGGKAMYLWDTGSASGTVTGTAGRLVVRARGEMCQGAPQLQARVNGIVTGAATVDSTTYRDYDLGSFPGGTQATDIRFTNNTGVQGVCDRNVFVDSVRVTAAAGSTTTPAPTQTTAPAPAPTKTATTAPTQTVAPVPAPAPGTAGQPLGASRAYSLVRADEFNGTALDTGLWTAKEPWNGAPGFEQGDQAFCPVPMSNRLVQVSGGSLKLNAIQEPAGGKPMQSCFVTTRGNLSMTHGYVEARVKIPAGADLWPAFWMMGNGDNSTGCPWPCTGEIDIFEFVNNGGENGMPHYTVHWACPNEWGHCQRSQDNPYPAKIAGYTDRWLTFGLERTATSLTVYIDGKKSYTLNSTDRTSDGKYQLAPVLFNGPMHIRFDNASSAGWSNDKTKAPEAGTFEIDYLRVWK